MEIIKRPVLVLYWPFLIKYNIIKRIMGEL
ncbi:hypothetical protein [Salmonella phage PHA46]